MYGLGFLCSVIGLVRSHKGFPVKRWFQFSVGFILCGGLLHLFTSILFKDSLRGAITG
jgi:hypothetical protein